MIIVGKYHNYIYHILTSFQPFEIQISLNFKTPLYLQT